MHQMHRFSVQLASLSGWIVLRILIGLDLLGRWQSTCIRGSRMFTVKSKIERKAFHCKQSCLFTPELTASYWRYGMHSTFFEKKPKIGTEWRIIHERARRTSNSTWLVASLWFPSRFPSIPWLRPNESLVDDFLLMFLCVFVCCSWFSPPLGVIWTFTRHISSTWRAVRNIQSF